MFDLKELFKMGGTISKKSEIVVGGIGLIFLLIIWYLVTKNGLIPTKILPNPVDVVKSYSALITELELFYDIDTNDLRRSHVVYQDVKYDFTINSQDIKPKWILQIWDSIPSQLNNKLKKFIFTQLGQNVRSREYFDVIKWLVKSMLIYKLDQVKNPNNKIPLKNNVEKKGYRLLLNDVGIAKRLLSITNEQIFLNKEYPNKNVFFEIFVYSQLSYLFKRKNMVYYSKGNFELDILLEYRELLIPINIKGSLLKANNAMKNYIKHNDVSIAIQYSFNYLKFENNLLIIPFYLINKTKEFLDFIINQNLHDKK